MMNFQTKFRNRKGFIDPIGPSFSSAKKWKIDIEGTKIEFRAPKHRPRIKLVKAEYPKKQYRYKNSDLIFRSLNKEIVVADIWEYVRLFRHDWTFNGPWFTGCLADVTMSILIYKSKEPNQSISFFHPRAFEQTIGDFLTNQYSKSKTDGKHDYMAPLNWQPINTISVPVARLEVIADGSISPYSKDEYLFFPIDDQHFITFVFHPSRSARGTEEEIDRKIGYNNLGKLIDNIINSVKVTLSPEAKQQQEKALEGLEDTSLVETFMPMKWSKSKNDTVVTNDKRIEAS